MTKFDEYVEEIEKRKQMQRQRRINITLQERLKTCTREQTLAALRMVLEIETITLQRQENSNYVTM